jgi:hypothetical protein
MGGAGFNFGGGKAGQLGSEQTIVAGTVQVTCKVKLTCLHGPGQ